MYLNVNQWLVHIKWFLHMARTLIWRNEPCYPFPRVYLIQPVWSHGTNINVVNILYPSQKNIDLIHMKVCNQGAMFPAAFSFPSAVSEGSFAMYIGCNRITRMDKKKGARPAGAKGCKWGQPKFLCFSLCSFKSLNHWQNSALLESCLPTHGGGP